MVEARTRAGRGAGLVGILTLIVGTVAACTGGATATSSPSAAPTSPSPSASESPSASASASVSPSASVAALDELAIEAADFKFGAPASIEAGPRRIVVNNIGQEDHQAQVAKIADDKTFQDLTTALGAEDIPAALGMLELVGGPTAVTPGASVSTAATFVPGQYVLLCFIESADGVPHLAKGMIAQLEVTGTASAEPLPEGDDELALQDFAFVGSTTLSPGQHTLTVTNKGPQVHEATILKLNEGVTVDQLRQAFTSTEPPSGPPPWTSAGGVAGVSVGTTVSMDVDLQAGNYAYVCFVPDPASGKPHAALGMVGELTVQ